MGYEYLTRGAIPARARLECRDRAADGVTAPYARWRGWSAPPRSSRMLAARTGAVSAVIGGGLMPNAILGSGVGRSRPRIAPSAVGSVAGLGLDRIGRPR